MTNEAQFHFFGIVDGSCKVEGVREKSTHFFEYKDLTAILRPAYFSEVDMFDKNKLVAFLKSYQETLENLHKTSTVLPIQLGTLSLTNSEVEEILQEYYEPLLSLIKLLNGKAEFEVQVRWTNINQVLKQLATTQEFISSIQSRGLQNGQKIQVDEQLYVGKLLADTLELKRKKITEETIILLAPYVFNFKTLPNTDESLATQISFLIDSAKEQMFFNELDKFSKVCEFSDLLKFRLIGPLVPYNFAQIELNYLKSNDIENFSSLLNLSSDILSGKELKNKMRELVKIYHPDIDKSHEEDFKRIISAYKLFSTLIEMEPTKIVELSNYKDRYVLTVPGITKEAVLV